MTISLTHDPPTAAMSSASCSKCQAPGPGPLKQCAGCMQVSPYPAALQHCSTAPLPLQVSYCSPACQKQHWRAHKPHCKPFRVVAVAGKGLGLVATRLIRRAELVIREQPLLVKVMLLVLVVRKSCFDIFPTLCMGRRRRERG